MLEIHNFKISKFLSKITSALIICAIVLSSSVTAARADDTAKALIGGVLAGVIASSIAAANQEPEQVPQPVPQDIVWQEDVQNNINTPRLSAADIQEQQRIKNIQSKLAQINFYNGAVDGIAGGQTSKAIEVWEIEFDQFPDSLISQSEYKLLEKLADNNITSQQEYAAYINTQAVKKEVILKEQPKDDIIKSEENIESKSSDLSVNRKEVTTTQEVSMSDYLIKLPAITWLIAIIVLFLLIGTAIFNAKSQGSEYGLSLIFNKRMLYLMITNMIFWAALFIDFNGTKSGVTTYSNTIVSFICYGITILYILRYNIRRSTILFGLYFTIVQVFVAFFGFIIAFFIIKGGALSKNKRR